MKRHLERGRRSPHGEQPGFKKIGSNQKRTIVNNLDRFVDKTEDDHMVGRAPYSNIGKR